MKSLKFAKILFLVLTLTSIYACKKDSLEPKPDYRTFTLYRDRHVSFPEEVSLFFHHEMNFYAKFNQSAMYDTQADNVRGINKLYGFSDCGDLHHENSARFGWEWRNNQLEISAYTYDNSSKHSFKLMGAVPLDTDVLYKIKGEDNIYSFEYSYKNNSGQTITQTATMGRGCSGDGGAKYKLGPYFGGQEKAPHDITVYVDELRL